MTPVALGATERRSCGVVGGALTSRPPGAPPVPAKLLAPSPFSGQAAATPQRRGGRCQGRGAPSGARAALTEGARQAATLFPRLAGLGFPLPPGRPWGADGARAPPAASASRAGFAAGARGRGRRRVGGEPNSAMGAPRSERKPLRLKREEGDPPYAQRGSGATRQGFGGAQPP